MLQLGRYSVNIGGFVDLSTVLLYESAKYLLVLLFAVLSIRLWKRVSKLSGQQRRNDLVVVCVTTLISVAIGYLSLRHSLSRLYSHYGMVAFNSGNVPSALSLFGQSSQYWKTADDEGAQGVCLLMLGRPDPGMAFINQAKIMRKGQNNHFEEFYEGLYYFFQDDPEGIPYLARSASDPIYTWSAMKLIATDYIDKNQLADAQQLMKPFLAVEVTDTDQAYVMASIDLFQGKKSEARALVNKFGAGDIPPFWKSRFDRLRIALQKP